MKQQHETAIELLNKQIDLDPMDNDFEGRSQSSSVNPQMLAFTKTMSSL